MLRLEYVDPIKRKIRKDRPVSELGISTYTRLEDAIREERKQEALDLVDYLWTEGTRVHDLFIHWTNADLIYVAARFGEEEVPRMLEHTRSVLFETFYQHLVDLSAEELVDWYAEAFRAHRTGPDPRGHFSVWEEKDRYVMEFDPCGSGGRMRRVREASPKAANMGKTKKGYPWSWGRAGVPYYCVHCCLWHEILPIDSRGYPVKIAEYSDDPMAPCRFYFYKNPSLIPEHYFTRVGKKRDPSLFQE